MMLMMMMMMMMMILIMKKLSLKLFLFPQVLIGREVISMPVFFNVTTVPGTTERHFLLAFLYASHNTATPALLYFFIVTKTARGEAH